MKTEILKSYWIRKALREKQKNGSDGTLEYIEKIRDIVTEKL